MSNTANKAPAYTPEQFEKLDGIIENYKSVKGALIGVLQKAQDVFGYLPMEVQVRIAEGLQIPIEQVYSTSTFYSQFFLTPKGKYKINVCIGTACYVKGAGDVLNEFGRQLGIASGECTEDMEFSLDGCRCIGACGLAPVLTINEDVHGKIYTEDVAGVLAQYLPAESQ
ncbi:MAG: NAD(P)H-dependent oxidoreductase subunit E [Defluviitaleaceae bacterium]|nr:NAD(P)H-dependent oxidoreductase subunit E [Defluviitaleaceae bacterium]